MTCSLSGKRAARTGEANMNRKTCDCGAPILRAIEDLGCVECGKPCCPVCAYTLESVSYCSSCAARFLDPADYTSRR
jgi:hypothetical protein